MGVTGQKYLHRQRREQEGVRSTGGDCGNIPAGPSNLLSHSAIGPGLYMFQFKAQNTKIAFVNLSTYGRMGAVYIVWHDRGKIQNMKRFIAAYSYM